MQQGISINKPLKAKAIYFKGNNKPLRDRLIYIAGNFLVVAQDENDTAPTWYNVDKVERLEGVEHLPTPPRSAGRAAEIWGAYMNPLGSRTAPAEGTAGNGNKPQI